MYSTYIMHMNLRFIFCNADFSVTFLNPSTTPFVFS